MSGNDFRRDALKAMEMRFGRTLVAQGNKTIKLKPNSQSLAADVVVCANHRTYTGPSAYMEGIMLNALQDKRRIVNYPKLHYRNGAAKGNRTWDRYKRTVRMFKSARNRLLSEGRLRRGAAPSYFLECLLYNAPDRCYQVSSQETYASIVNWMMDINLQELVCQKRSPVTVRRSPRTVVAVGRKGTRQRIGKPVERLDIVQQECTPTMYMAARGCT